jgi:DNA primase
VDFAAIKRAVSLQAVLHWYQVQGLKRSGDQLRGPCPVHGRGAEDAFHVSLAKNAFRCFYCQTQGNVLDFVAAMERCSLREAALRLQERFAVGCGSWRAGAAPHPTQLVPKKENANPPLPFTLSRLDYRHAYIRQRDITPETAQYFGAGLFAGQGLLSGRLVIPIHDERGNLVAYCGRSLDGAPPRYKLPPGFRKSLVLFNLHRATADRRQVVVVEGFFDCMKVHQAGFPCVVALMGATLSETQQRLLLEHFQNVVIMLDGDQPGRTASDAIATRLTGRCTFSVVELAAVEQPDQLSDDRIRSLLQPVVPTAEVVHNTNMSRPGSEKVSAMSPG